MSDRTTELQHGVHRQQGWQERDFHSHSRQQTASETPLPGPFLPTRQRSSSSKNGQSNRKRLLVSGDSSRASQRQ